ncbi:class IV adenylate cyclase [Myroides albus]|uniref:CYTH domain-containing protein n=1 Tax=Myroides albus TaxID=2562892 RepID=A0A6I3LGQ0_9FLAO|nr:class IV adenylate cyclase [Myroides albus]MTG97383.1 CYTH domain-containing protein [Myroides albus]UVD79412.1 class IV adenylate cyclase [Myroides albus]
MEVKNIEFKAKVENLDRLIAIAELSNIKLEGSYKQVDTYYDVPKGRVKLREYGNFSSLIYYNRENTKAVKQSDVIYYQHAPNQALSAILELQFGVKVRVSKVRKIYKVDNVSIHFDQVDGLGCFVEVEACSEENNKTVEDLQKQCDYFFNLFKLTQADLIEQSYSDLVLSLQLQ